MSFLPAEAEEAEEAEGIVEILEQAEAEDLEAEQVVDITIWVNLLMEELEILVVEVEVEDGAIRRTIILLLTPAEEKQALMEAGVETEVTITTPSVRVQGDVEQLHRMISIIRAEQQMEEHWDRMVEVAEAVVDGRQMGVEGHHHQTVMVVEAEEAEGQEAGMEVPRPQLEMETQVWAMVLEAVGGFTEPAVPIDVVEAEAEADSVQKPIRKTVKGQAG